MTPINAATHWQKIGPGPHHGICLPLFSLRTKNSSGIGEFLDLLPLIDWCKEMGLDCIQLLPLNDTGYDPSPYNPLSSIALDPVYLSLTALATTDIDIQLSRNDIKKQKLQWLKTYFHKSYNSLAKTAPYQTFIETQSHWLVSYALFITLKEELGYRTWEDWPKIYHSNQQSHVEERGEEIAFHSFVQFLCFSQMEQVRAHASKQGVFLQGDISFMVSRDSVDVWSRPSLFQLQWSAGTPPDQFAPKGQNWGFPPFDWDAMRKENFAWWKERLKVSEQFFHLYRIDHVVGLFRIWASPVKKEISLGSFLPADPNQWESQGKEVLEMMLQATTMLPIAEDLGTIPAIVYSVLKNLGICGTKVPRWEKKSDGSYVPFKEYEPLSMTTLSTPDIDPLELWWKKYPTESALFAEFMNIPFHPMLSAKNRMTIMQAAHHTPSIFHINLLQEYLAFFPELVSLNPEKERINYPGTILPTNWTYRFRPFLEEIITHEGLRQVFAKLLQK